MDGAAVSQTLLQSFSICGASMRADQCTSMLLGSPYPHACAEHYVPATGHAPIKQAQHICFLR